jgi:hypothetical protein
MTSILQVIRLDTKLTVDGQEIELNEFAQKILAGMTSGAVTSLRGTKKDWKEISITVTR